MLSPPTRLDIDDQDSTRGVSPSYRSSTQTDVPVGWCWWSHPKVKENWKVFTAAFGLLVFGTALIIMGVVVTVLPDIDFHSYVFFIAGAICFIPGAYHVVYVYFAVRGRKGYDFYQLPMFA
ncbi:putative transmembrane protein [Halotydeus destructor]|nr:putative transmembrane protein [Halotydeus destructor]